MQRSSKKVARKGFSPEVEERRTKALHRRQALYGLPDAIRAADRGQTKALCEFLREWIPDEAGEMFAELIDRRLQAGRPKGRTKNRPVDTTPTAEMERRAYTIVNRMRRQAPRPLKRGQLNQWITDVLNRLGDDGDLSGLNVSEERIKAMLDRGQKRRSKVAPKP